MEVVFFVQAGALSFFFVFLPFGGVLVVGVVSFVQAGVLFVLGVEVVSFVQAGALPLTLTEVRFYAPATTNANVRQ